MSDCNNLFTPEVRALCPQTCGCSDPRAGLFLVRPMYGCPNACILSRGFREKVDAIPCMDPSREELRVNHAWLRFWDGRANFQRQSINVDSLEHSFATSKGCGILDLFSHASWCSPLDSVTGSATSLRLWCPQRCGCAGSVDSSCPAQCKNATPWVSQGQTVDMSDGKCSSLSWSGMEVQCTIFMQGSQLFQMTDPQKSECCAAVNQLVAIFFSENKLDPASVKTICCGDCTRSFFAEPMIRMVVEGQGYDETTFCDPFSA